MGVLALLVCSLVTIVLTANAYKIDYYNKNPAQNNEWFMVHEDNTAHSANHHAYAAYPHPEKPQVVQNQHSNTYPLAGQSQIQYSNTYPPAGKKQIQYSNSYPPNRQVAHNPPAEEKQLQHSNTYHPAEGRIQYSNAYTSVEPAGIGHSNTYPPAGEIQHSNTYPAQSFQIQNTDQFTDYDKFQNIFNNFETGLTLNGDFGNPHMVINQGNGQLEEQSRINSQEEQLNGRDTVIKGGLILGGNLGSVKGKRESSQKYTPMLFSAQSGKREEGMYGKQADLFSELFGVSGNMKGVIDANNREYGFSGGIRHDENQRDEAGHENFSKEAVDISPEDEVRYNKEAEAKVESMFAKTLADSERSASHYIPHTSVSNDAAAEVHYHKHKHVHKHKHTQDHKHNHEQEHLHAHLAQNDHTHEHHEEHKHDHMNKHAHTHAHRGQHVHDHRGDHKHDHAHKHAHTAEHKHAHHENHKHDHGHNHHHGHHHDHKGQHKHDHHHGHKESHHAEHEHDHKHGHKHGHKHWEDHGHKHGHKHGHEDWHTHSHKHTAQHQPKW